MSLLISGGKVEKVSLKLSTRKLRDIENALSLEPLTPGDHHQIKDIRAKYSAALHKPKSVTKAYNCHGMTFASRRSAIWKASDLEMILLDDDYEQVPVANVLPGDIVIYRNSTLDGNEIEHSGIVVERPLNQGGIPAFPRVLSKWGMTHEVVHFANDCPYSLLNVSYYRVSK